MGRPKYWNGSAWTEVAPSAQEYDAHKVDYTLQIPYAVTTGTANVYAISLPIAALAAGMAVSVRINVASSAASTLNWNGKGAKGIKKADGTNVTNLKLNGVYTLRYDGTNFILQGEGGVEGLVPGVIKEGVVLDGVTGTLVEKQGWIYTQHVGAMNNPDWVNKRFTQNDGYTYEFYDNNDSLGMKKYDSAGTLILTNDYLVPAGTNGLRFNIYTITAYQDCVIVHSTPLGGYGTSVSYFTKYNFSGTLLDEVTVPSFTTASLQSAPNKELTFYLATISQIELHIYNRAGTKILNATTSPYYITFAGPNLVWLNAKFFICLLPNSGDSFSIRHILTGAVNTAGTSVSTAYSSAFSSADNMARQLIHWLSSMSYK